MWSGTRSNEFDYGIERVLRELSLKLTHGAVNIVLHNISFF